MMMKPVAMTWPLTRIGVLAGALLALPSAAPGDAYISSNASSNPSQPALAPAATTGSGVAAPGGGFWSEVGAISASESNALAGVSGQAYGGIGAFRYAEDFTVPASRVWNLTSVSVYAYQPGASAPPALSPFSAINVQVWNGRPGDPGSAVVWGDTVTNRLAAATSTGMYRVFNTVAIPPTTPDTTRLIWKLDASVSISLPPGTYWLDWQVVTVDPLGEAFAPTATIPGTRTSVGWNALQFKPLPPTPTAPSAGGGWSAISDPGKPVTAADAPQELPFILRGTITGCLADFNSVGGVTIDDLFLYFNAYFTGDPRADYNSSGDVSIDDLFLYINGYFLGCP